MAASMWNTVYKAYLYKNLFNDARRFARRNLKNVRFDPDNMLHRVGLTRYRPYRYTVTSLSMLLLGGITGALFALAFAPKAGTEMRSQVRDRAMKMFERGAALGAETPARA